MRHAALPALFVLSCLGAGCSRSVRSVVVYCSVDDVVAKPILSRFEERTKIDVRPLYDTEATKGAGLVARLIAEKSNPKADVYWNSEMSRTLALAQAGVLQVYRSPVSGELPPAYRDPDGLWSGTTPRTRVIVYNTERIKANEAPSTLAELAAPRWRGKVGICDMHIGTASSWITALAHAWGDERLRRWLTALRENEVRVLPGNSVVADQVARGELLVGVTDTDDVWTRKLDGLPVQMVQPDQRAAGTVAIPCSVAMVKGAGRPEPARQLIDYLLSAEVERTLVMGSARHYPLRASTKPASGAAPLGSIKVLPVQWPRVATDMARVEALVDAALSRQPRGRPQR